MEVPVERGTGLSPSLTSLKSGWSFSASARAVRLSVFPSSSRSRLLSRDRAMALASLSAPCSCSMTYGSRTRVFLACWRHTISFL